MKIPTVEFLKFFAVSSGTVHSNFPIILAIMIDQSDLGFQYRASLLDLRSESPMYYSYSILGGVISRGDFHKSSLGGGVHDKVIHGKLVT